MGVDEMTAADILRRAARVDASAVLELDRLCGANCSRVSFLALADKIEAEIEAARSESLRQGAVLWAKANGWPDLRDGEGFGEWLHRCALPRPRFADGEPVQFGDRVRTSNGSLTVHCITIGDKGLEEISSMSDGSGYVARSPFQRPAPEVLDAYGVPIKVGDTVWLLPGDWCNDGPLWGFVGGEECIVVENFDDDHREAGRICVVPPDGGCCGYPYPSQVTHKEPDSMELIRKDAKKSMSEYWDCGGISCEACPAKVDGKTPDERYGTGEDCRRAQTLDLLARVERVMGGGDEQL